MKSITELEESQRDALMFWASDMTGKEPIIIIDPHNYLSETGGFLIMDITQETRRDSFEVAKQHTAVRG